MCKWMCAAVVVIAVASTFAADTKAPAAIDEAATLRAENKLLKRQLDRQAEEIQELKDKLKRSDARVAAAEQEKNDALSFAAEAQLKGRSDPANREEIRNTPATKPAPIVGARGTVLRENDPNYVIYVVDTSGSMYDEMKPVKDEVYKGIAGLPLAWEVDVALATESGIKRFVGGRKIRTKEHTLLAELGEFLDKAESHGIADLAGATKKALSEGPQVIWLITDDTPEVGQPQRFLADLRAASKGGTLVNTMVSNYRVGDDRGANLPEGVQLLAEVAAAFGGRCVDRDGKVIEPGSLHSPKKRVETTTQRTAPRPAKASTTRPTGKSVLDLR